MTMGEIYILLNDLKVILEKDCRRRNKSLKEKFPSQNSAILRNLIYCEKLIKNSGKF